MEAAVTANPAASRAKAFEVFVKRTISQIHKEAWGRSKEVRDLREACDKFLTAIEGGDSQMSQLEEMVLQVLPPLQLACQTNIPKVVELSLGCLHKLVAHAWLQGESQLSSPGSGPSGDVVAAVVQIVAKHADSNSQALQLAVLRALLTFATAEHFVAHGDCLLSAVRTVFNLALSSIDSDIKRTAGNALLQMLNTITKRVTQYHFRSSRFSDTSSALSTPVSREPTTPAMPVVSSKDLRESKLTTAGSMEVEAELMSDQERAAQFKRMAEQRDMRGLERALEEAAAQAAAEEAEAEAAGHLEPGLASMSAPGSPSTPACTYTPSAEAGGRMHMEAGFAAMLNLPPLKTLSRNPKLIRMPMTLVEKDVLLVLTAFCKLASCEPEKTSAEAYMQHGKLLALELLVKVLQNPHHNWGNVRDELFRHLRQPLCLALLKNCATGNPQAFSLAVQLLVAMLLLPKLRRGLRAEMGALYPLLILRAMEQYAGGWQEGVVDSAALLQLLQVLRSLCSDAQLLVDLFVNYDCDLNAANLYERTINALSRLCTTAHEPPSNVTNSQQAKEAAASAAISDAALQCLQAVIGSLDAWAGPLKDSLTRSNVDSLTDPISPEVDQEATGSPGSKTEAEVFGAAKAHKSSLTKGIEIFKNNPTKGIAFLISTGVIEDSPVKVAEFLMTNLQQLNKTALGEYLGHHEEFETLVMHAFVDRQRYVGVKIDLALRALLEQFRLPGEAQKIDRIMEKFAERYCKDNPNVFRTADAAYVLAFSIIMLNTDAHNPMAERRLNKATFVEMNRQQHNSGMDTVLPLEELEGIYERIVSKEITLRGEGNDSRKSHQFVLAAALGLTQLVTPLRALAASFGSKQSSVELERIAVLRQAEQALAQGTLSSVTWHISTHAEHTCPMLQVTGSLLFEALRWSLANSQDVKQVVGVLASLAVLIKLTSLLGLDSLCECCVAAVADAAGVFDPAPPGSRQELIQLRAFKVLVGLPLCPEGGLLGSSWPIVLRCLSAVEALQLEHLKASQQPAKVDDSSSAKSLSKMFQALGFSINSTLGIKKPNTPTSHTGGDESFPDGKFVKDAAAVLLWAETEGHALVERIYSQSSHLDGESVIVFVRALSAISQEELELNEPRLFSLHKLVESAFHNMSRIRLVWSKLWSVVSAHLVGASCHPNSRVAMYAVDSLKQLVIKLLARAELANFTHQEEALRPFVSVLRQCDDPAVRELTVQCVVQAATSHPRGLGSGWRMVIEAVTRGVKDTSGPVVLQAMEALQIVAGALYLGPGVGHECFVESLNAIVAAIHNPHHTQLAAPAVQLLLLCAQRLAECCAAEGDKRYPQHVQAGWAPLLQALLELLSRDTCGSVVNACMEGLYKMMQLYSHCWDTKTWEVVLNQVLDHLFRLPSGEVLSSPAEEQAVVDTFLERCQRFVPRICERVALIDECMGGDMLQRLVGMALAWTSHPSPQLSVAGLQSFQQMVLCLSPYMHPPSWRLLLSSLWVCVQALLNQMLAQFQQLLEIHSRTALFLRPADPNQLLDEPALLLSNFHGRCRLMLLLQRSLGSIHHQCRTHMAPDVQLQLFHILKATVDTAISINHMSAAVLLPAMPAPIAPTITLTNKYVPAEPSPGIKANRPVQRSNSKQEDLGGPGQGAAATPVLATRGSHSKPSLGVNSSISYRSDAWSVEGDSPQHAAPVGLLKPRANSRKVGDTSNVLAPVVGGTRPAGTPPASLSNGTPAQNGTLSKPSSNADEDHVKAAGSETGGHTHEHAADKPDGGREGLANAASVDASPKVPFASPTMNIPTSPDVEGSIAWSVTSPRSAAPITSPKLPEEYVVTPRAEAMRLVGPYTNMPDGFAALPPVATGSGPVVRSSPVGSDTVAPAVLRMEVQGGLMLIMAYKRALAVAGGSPLGMCIDAAGLGPKPTKPDLDLMSPNKPTPAATSSGPGSAQSSTAVQCSSAAVQYSAAALVATANLSGAGEPERCSGNSAFTTSAADGSPIGPRTLPAGCLATPPPATTPDTISPSPLWIPAVTNFDTSPVLSDDILLWDFCCEILSRAAQAVERPPSASRNAGDASATSQPASTAAAVMVTNAAEVTPTAEHTSRLTSRTPKMCGWYRDAHAPLIGSALEAVRELTGASGVSGGTQGRERLVALFPLLVGLIQYRHPMVQTTLAALMEDKLGPELVAACKAQA